MKLVTVIITAGGIGTRMGANVPKQFLELAGKPVLFHTLEQFHGFDKQAELILTLPGEWLTFWEQLIQKYTFTIPHKVVEGGEHRFDSVRNALLVAKGEYVAVHDGVRPFVNFDTLERCWKNVQQGKAVVPVLAVKDSIREVNNEHSHAVDRSLYRLVQTPQCFEYSLLLKAYQTAFDGVSTDDASLVEKLGVNIHLVEGNEENFKITTPLDMILAEELARNSAK